MQKLRQRLLTAATALSLTGLGIAGGAVPAQAAGEAAAKKQPATTALVHPNLALPGTASGISKSDPVSKLLMSDRVDLDPVKVKVPAGTEAQQRAAAERAARAAAPKWQKQLDAEARKGLSAKNYETYKDYDSDIVYGDCGYSTVELGDEYEDLLAFTSGSFHLNKPGFGYSATVEVWDPDWLDFSSWEFDDEGDLNGGTEWDDSNLFYVDEESEYSAQLSAVVYTGDLNWCFSGGPRVDGVTID